MTIGIVLASLPGYSETFFTSKIKGLQEKGIKVLLFTQSAQSEFNLCPVKKAPRVYGNALLQIVSMCWIYVGLLPRITRVLHYIALERKENTRWLDVLKKIYLNAHLLKAHLDWVHFGFATQALGSELVAKAIGAKMAVSFRGFDIHVYPLKHPKCYTLLWKHVDKIHSISNHLLQEGYVLGLNKNVPCTVITPAVSLNFIKNQEAEEKNTCQIKLITIARLHWIKGIDMLIETAYALKQQEIDFTWDIIGSGNGTEVERYQFHIFQKNLEQQVTLVGKLEHSNVLQQLHQANIYVQTSLNEGFCNAVLEAQAIGKLTIATNVGGLPENIEHGKTGWLVPAMEPEIMAKRIIEVIGLSDTEKNNISQQAINRVHEKFNLLQQQIAFANFYK